MPSITYLPNKRLGIYGLESIYTVMSARSATERSRRHRQRQSAGNASA